jgi:hypothetical protein
VAVVDFKLVAETEAPLAELRLFLLALRLRWLR